MGKLTLTNVLVRVLRRPGFWLILGLLLLISIPHYAEYLKYPVFITNIMATFGLQRHAFERILCLIPIIWSGFLFGWKGTLSTSLAALGLMLPRALIISTSKADAIFETSIVFIIGNLAAFSFSALRKMREQNIRIKNDIVEMQKLYQEQKKITEELWLSGQKYREIFENANDAIWLHDLEGNITNANQATEKLTGYSIEELLKMNMKNFFPESNKAGMQTDEQSITRKDGSEAFVQMTTSQIMIDNTSIAFQHIARDVTEERRLQQNLHYYLHQVTRAQEEERKRISRELHDDTIQSLVVLSRSLDSLASGNNELSAETRLQLEELRRQTNNIMGEIRRLSQDLRPAALDRLGLRSALELLAADIAQYSGITTKVIVTGTERRFSEEVELVLFRIAQEALRNVWKHSKATHVDITMENSEECTRVKIQDNGTGFDVLKTTGELNREGRLGLAGMRERAHLIGGTLTIRSEIGKGSIITIEVPNVK